MCQAPPNFIVTGSGTVEIDGLPAARIDDRTMHPPPGRITGGSPDVLIGGPTVGVRLGGADAGGDACKSAATGRESHSTKQTYNNCGVESARQIINQATGGSIREDALLDDAFEHGDAEKERSRHDSGGTGPEDRRNILSRHNVESELVAATPEALAQAVAERKGVITSHEVKYLWPDLTQEGGHAVTVIGIDFDAEGRPSRVVYNDTGRGQCQHSAPWATFFGSLRPGRDMNVTKAPIW